MEHNSVGPLRSIPPITRALATISIVLSLVFALAAFGVPGANSWTDQGRGKPETTGIGVVQVYFLQ
jgi:TRAP-type C4-dicarboxylate transport system permease small subunit